MYFCVGVECISVLPHRLMDGTLGAGECTLPTVDRHYVIIYKSRRSKKSIK